MRSLSSVILTLQLKFLNRGRSYYVDLSVGSEELSRLQ